jgi:hypothetical protein
MRLLLVLLASLLFAAPAMAQDPQGATVGQGQVITDLTTEVEPPAGEDDATDIPPVDDGTPAPAPQPDATGRRGEIHVLNSTSSESSPPPATAPVSAPAPTPVSTAAAPARPAGAAKTLPFTGIDAGPLALIGLALLAAGSGLLAVLRQPVQ